MRTKHGVVLLLDPAEFVDHRILRCGFYEEEVFQEIGRHLEASGAFWDIGANIGLHSVTVAKLGLCSAVYAFEPNVRLAEVIEREAKRNRCALTIFPIALDATEGEQRFYLYPGNAGRSGFYNWQKDTTEVRVRTGSGDAIVAQDPEAMPTVVKLDVEGAELRVLQGMSRVLAHPKLKCIVFEDPPDENSAVKTLLLEHGFAIRELRRLDSEEHALKNFSASR